MKKIEIKNTIKALIRMYFLIFLIFSGINFLRYYFDLPFGSPTGVGPSIKPRNLYEVISHSLIAALLMTIFVRVVYSNKYTKKRYVCSRCEKVYLLKDDSLHECVECKVALMPLEGFYNNKK